MLTPCLEGVLRFFLVMAFSQPGGQMLQEHLSWPKGAGGKKHPPPAGLRPPSAREGGGGGVLPLQHQKGIVVLRKHLRERWILPGCRHFHSVGSKRCHRDHLREFPPLGTAVGANCPDGMNPARRAVLGQTAFPEKFPFSF